MGISIEMQLTFGAGSNVLVCIKEELANPLSRLVPMLRILHTKEAKVSTTEERDAERRRSAEKALRRETMVRRIKDIVWAAVIASVITIVVISLGWLTTQAVVEKARGTYLSLNGIVTSI